MSNSWAINRRPAGVAGAVRVAGEHDTVADRERQRSDRVGGQLGVRVGVKAHLVKVGAEAAP